MNSGPIIEIFSKYYNDNGGRIWLPRLQSRQPGPPSRTL